MKIDETNLCFYVLFLVLECVMHGKHPYGDLNVITPLLAVEIKQLAWFMNYASHYSCYTLSPFISQDMLPTSIISGTTTFFSMPSHDGGRDVQALYFIRNI